MNFTDMNFTDKDYLSIIIKYFQGYSELKKLSEINKSSNIFVESKTKFRSIVRDKKNKYNCDMLKCYLIKKVSYELNNNDYKNTLNKVRKSVKNFRNLTDKENWYMTYKINVHIYTNSMNKNCLPYLEEIISYYFDEKKKYYWLDIDNVSIHISKILYNIILSIDNNYKLKNEKILLWISTNKK